MESAAGFRIDSRSLLHRVRAAPDIQVDRRAAQRPSYLVPLLALSGVILPTQVQILLGPGMRFTPGRAAIALLLIPAVITLFRSGRRRLLCDLFVFLTAIWMIFAGVSVAGTNALSSAGGDALDLLGGYVIARAFVFGPMNLDAFVRVLRAFAITAVIFAIADNLSGRLLVQEAIATVLRASPPPSAGFRHGMIRATSTFDHEILFGVFCALSGAIIMYYQRKTLSRIALSGFCFLGCILSLSSASIMVFIISACVYCYDQLMKRDRSRWMYFWVSVGILISAAIAAVPNPLGWIVSRLTLDPQTGYFRMMIWDVALIYIGQSPIIGYGYGIFGNDIIDGSVDAIWLLAMLRFGIPMLILFFLANVSAIFPERKRPNGDHDVFVERMRQAFTLVVLLFMFSGLTVHFWNFMWMFWGLCLGVRASLRELSTGNASTERAPVINI